MLSCVVRCIGSAHSCPPFSHSLAHLGPSLTHLSRSLALFGPHMAPSPSMGPRPVEGSIRSKLSHALEPDHLEVHNESHMHAVPPGSESHFRVLIVSAHFQGRSLLQRHRLVHDALKEELSGPVHALAIQARTPEQWHQDPRPEKSPPCMGGAKGDPTVEEKLMGGKH